MLMNVSGFSDSPIRLDAWLYLDEVTHRALNDYTAMLAIVRRASSTITDKVGLAALGDVAKRLESAAQTYRTLRPSWASSMRNLEDDLERLCASLTSAILADRSINLTLTSEPVSLSAKRCWQISLVISELVMNAAKHAFSKSGSGEIVVRVRAVGDMLQCAVIDDGRAGPDYAPGRGSGIVDVLAADLGGCIVRRLSRNGSTIILSIPMDQPDAVLRRHNLPLVGIAPAGLPVASEADSGTTDRLDERLDEALEESFPASDPPAVHPV
jgi:two-component system, sensor histidine kinase PdtaS